MKFCILPVWKRHREAFFTYSKFCRTEKAVERTILIVEIADQRLLAVLLLLFTHNGRQIFPTPQSKLVPVESFNESSSLYNC